MQNKKAQSFVVYAALIAIIAGAFIIISTYLRRSVSGKYRQTGDVFGGGSQYEPGVTNIQGNDTPVE